MGIKRLFLSRYKPLPAIAVICLCLCSLAALAEVPPFVGAQMFLIDDSAGKDLSGLDFCNGQLYANSDKIDNTIYAIELRGNSAKLVSAQSLPPMPTRTLHYEYPANVTYWYHYLFSGDFLDWEDIQCRGDSIYLLSERKNGIARVTLDKKMTPAKAEWLPIDWYEPVHKAGYLNAYNAYVEGLAIIDANHFLVALERQPRGLMDLQKQSDGHWQIKAMPLSDDLHLPFREHSADVAALALKNGWLFTLERNASAVCRRDLIAYKAESCFSYQAIEDDPRYRYRDHKFGLGEGLAIDEQFIYIVFDNNNQPREADAQDRRGLLLKIPLPAVWR